MCSNRYVFTLDLLPKNCFQLCFENARERSRAINPLLSSITSCKSGLAGYSTQTQSVPSPYAQESNSTVPDFVLFRSWIENLRDIEGPIDPVPCRIDSVEPKCRLKPEHTQHGFVLDAIFRKPSAIIQGILSDPCHQLHASKQEKIQIQFLCSSPNFSWVLSLSLLSSPCVYPANSPQRRSHVEFMRQPELNRSLVVRLEM